jgi:hypothetical protein
MRRLWRLARPATFTVALVMLSTGVLNGAGLQTPGVSVPVPEAPGDLLRWALTQGGLVVVLLVILWSYRKDFMSTLQQQRDVTTQMAAALKEASGALATHSEAVRAQSVAFAQLADSVRRCEAVRELVDR